MVFSTSLTDTNAKPFSISFVDSQILNAHQILDQWQSSLTVLLDPTRDGIEQITETLSHYQQVTGIEIISHGNIGQVLLGDRLINQDTLGTYTTQLQQWQNSLAKGADILFYGCNLAVGTTGQSFVNQFHTLTGADIAASTNLTGHSQQGGDWLLEYQTGSIETANQVPVSLINDYLGTFSTQSLFSPTATPAILNATDGSGSNGDYELGMEFKTAIAGEIQALRYYKASSETGTHIGKIWSNTGQLLASVTFSNETASGWQEQALTTPFSIAANTTYVVSVNTNQYYVATSNGLGTTLTNGDITAVADGSNGVFNATPGLFPNKSYKNTNYFRDIVFASPPPPNTLGQVSISGTAVQNQSLTATVTDPDGLTGANINYQWQQSSNGTDWANISGQTNSTLTLDSSLIGQRIRVQATYMDALGYSENIFSLGSNPITVAMESLFKLTATPAITNATDKVPYELGMEFRSAQTGTIQSIRYWKAPSETGTHVGKIWSSSGQLLASVTFSNETASGWQQQLLDTPLSIAANLTYVVSVNTNSYYAATLNGLATTLTSGALSAVADGSNGVFGNPNLFPTRSHQNTNYYRDITFLADLPPASNQPGIASINGITTQNQTLTASVTDLDGLNNLPILYQWQQSQDNGLNWTNIVGATASNLILGQTQVNKPIRVLVNYIDNLGNNESLISAQTGSILNVNDPGNITISGDPILGSILGAVVADLDGLVMGESQVPVNYQWQQSEDGGVTWSNLTDKTQSTLLLDSSLVGKQVRATASYVDVFGTGENVVSGASREIILALNSFFTPTSTPVVPNITDGVAYELGLEFSSTTPGKIQAIRYWKAPSETGTHIGKIWSSTGNLLVIVPFENETASGWQEQELSTPLAIPANTIYVVSVNANSYYSATNYGLVTQIKNGAIQTITDGSNGVYGGINAFPTRSFQNSNYFRDIVFHPELSLINNPGSISLSGTPIQNQTLTALVTDLDGVNGEKIDYQWQRLVNNQWVNIAGAFQGTFVLNQADVGKTVRATAIYVDLLGNIEQLTSAPTTVVLNMNNPGLVILKGSPTLGGTLGETVIDSDGINGSINYQWQELVSNIWTNIAGATSKSLALTSVLLNQQVRLLASYIDALGSAENVASSGVTITAQNAIALENQNAGTTDWRIPTVNLATDQEIEGYGDATSINRGGVINLKISLAQPGKYNLEVYRLGYYGGLGGRLITSVADLDGLTQATPTMSSGTYLVEYNWNTSFTLQTGENWTTGLYFVKLTDIRTGKQSYIQFVLRDDQRPTDLGFQDAITTAQAYNNAGGSSLYAQNEQPQARIVSFDRPFVYDLGSNQNAYNNTLTWEYNMVRWLESQGYDVSYYTNLDVHTNPLQLYSQRTFLSVGHDEYWSMEMFDHVTQARDRGINLGFFSANTAYWRVRFEPSGNGQANRRMVSYKENWNLDPIAQMDISQATTWFRSVQLNRPENSLLGVAYIGDYGNRVYDGFDFVVTNSSDPYYAYTGLQNGDRLSKLVGYEWDAVLNNGFSPNNLVILAESPVIPRGSLPPLPPGTNLNISQAVRYTAASGAKVFSTGSVQWVWGLDSDGVTNPRSDVRAQQMTVNIFADMGVLPTNLSGQLVMPIALVVVDPLTFYPS